MAEAANFIQVGKIINFNTYISEKEAQLLLSILDKIPVQGVESMKEVLTLIEKLDRLTSHKTNEEL